MPPNPPARTDTGSCSGMEPSATARKYLHTCISGKALPARLTESLIPSRERGKQAYGWGWGRVLHVGVAPPHPLAQAHTWGRGAFTKVCPKCQDAFALRTENNLEKFFTCFTRLTEDANQAFFRTAHVYCPGHLSTSQQNVPGQYFQTNLSFQTDVAKRYRLLFLSAKANAKHLKGNPVTLSSL